jgi:hypothetical protein
MSDQEVADLREEVRSRYAAAVRVVLKRKAEQARSCCGSSVEGSCCEYLDGLATTGFTDTTEAAPGMHSAIIRAIKPMTG